MNDTEQDNKSINLCSIEDQLYRGSTTLDFSGLKLLEHKGLLSKGGAEGGIYQEKLFVSRNTHPETELYLNHVEKETCLEYRIIKLWKM